VKQIVACVPNFSEGRRQGVIDRIVAAMGQCTGAQVLDVQSDPDHNRSVVTIIGAPQAVVETVFQGVVTAAELIDMDHHRGGHPRMGATDVIPFVPVRGVTLDDCVELARQLGQRMGAELGIPVYLYEKAATRPDRRNLADVRRGEYEGLKKEIATNPDRAPDFGPAVLGIAGASAIGARPPLIAFNVYLNTGDVGPAKAIARSVRHSSGGLRFVKALGLIVEGQAQISMNLTDYRRTPIHRVLELIRIEAAHYGLAITHSEIVGLLPANALIDAAQFYLQLASFSPGQILENRLSEEAQAMQSS
jgi:glutamate formiminotransferase